jgi:hypothetical protein
MATKSRALHSKLKWLTQILRGMLKPLGPWDWAQLKGDQPGNSMSQPPPPLSTLNYAPPPPGKDLRRVAVYQRNLNLCILVNIVVYAALIYLGIENGPMLLRGLLGLLVMGVGITASVFVFMLSLQLYSIAGGIVLGYSVADSVFWDDLLVDRQRPGDARAAQEQYPRRIARRESFTNPGKCNRELIGIAIFPFIPSAPPSRAGPLPTTANTTPTPAAGPAL